MDGAFRADGTGITIAVLQNLWGAQLQLRQPGASANDYIVKSSSQKNPVWEQIASAADCETLKEYFGIKHIQGDTAGPVPFDSRNWVRG